MLEVSGESVWLFMWVRRGGVCCTTWYELYDRTNDRDCSFVRADEAGGSRELSF